MPPKLENKKCRQTKTCNLKYETPVNLPMGKNSWAKYLVWTEKEMGGLEEKEKRTMKETRRQNFNPSLGVLTRGGPTKPKQSKVLISDLSCV